MPNTPACVFSLAVVCVRLFAAPVEAGYVTSSALLSRPPSQSTDLEEDSRRRENEERVAQYNYFTARASNRSAWARAGMG